MLYIESAAVYIVYGAHYVLFMDRELQNKREKNDISRLKSLYLQIKNLEKIAKEAVKFTLSYKLEMKSANS